MEDNVQGGKLTIWNGHADHGKRTVAYSWLKPPSLLGLPPAQLPTLLQMVKCFQIVFTYDYRSSR